MMSIAVKGALIAIGGMAITVVASVVIVTFYCCTCHRRHRRGGHAICVMPDA